MKNSNVIRKETADFITVPVACEIYSMSRLTVIKYAKQANALCKIGERMQLINRARMTEFLNGKAV